VPVFDAMLAPAPQPGQLRHPLLGVPDLQPLGVQPHFHPFANQPAGHRVDIAGDPDDAASLDPHAQPLARLQAAGRQRLQHRQFLGQADLPSFIALGEELAYEAPVPFPRGKVPAPAQQQCLPQRSLELVVALLRIAVLVGLASIDGLPTQSVMAQQRLIALLEHFRLRLPRLHRRRQPVGAMHCRHAAQLPQRILQPLAQALQALRKTNRARLPVRVGQHEMVHQVWERRAGDGHLQLGAVREVRSTQPARRVDLGEEHFLGRPLLGPPLLEPSL
jgi:hypothetical protein